VHQSLIFKRMYIFNISDPVDFYDHAFTATIGSRVAGEAYPPFGCFSLRFVRRRADMRHGYKRFGGLSESDVAGGYLQSGLVTAINTLKGKIVDPWVNPSLEEVCNFCIVKRIPYVVEGSGKTAYRMPESAGEYISYFPTQAVLLGVVTTQNSRKFGRGA